MLPIPTFPMRFLVWAVLFVATFSKLTTAIPVQRTGELNILIENEIDETLPNQRDNFDSSQEANENVKKLENEVNDEQRLAEITNRLRRSAEIPDDASLFNGQLTYDQSWAAGETRRNAISDDINNVDKLTSDERTNMVSQEEEENASMAQKQQQDTEDGDNDSDNDSDNDNEDNKEGEEKEEPSEEERDTQVRESAKLSSSTNSDEKNMVNDQSMKGMSSDYHLDAKSIAAVSKKLEDNETVNDSAESDNETNSSVEDYAQGCEVLELNTDDANETFYIEYKKHKRSTDNDSQSNDDSNDSHDHNNADDDANDSQNEEDSKNSISNDSQSNESSGTKSSEEVK